MATEQYEHEDNNDKDDKDEENTVNIVVDQGTNNVETAVEQHSNDKSIEGRRSNSRSPSRHDDHRSHSSKGRNSRKRKRSSSSEESETDSSSSEEETYSYTRFQADFSEESNKWSLPQDMADYANKIFTKYISEKDIKDNIS